MMINEDKNDNVVKNMFKVGTVKKGLASIDHFRGIQKIEYLKCLNDLKDNSKLVIRTKSGEEYLFGKDIHERIVINNVFLYNTLEHSSKYEKSYLDIEVMLKAEHTPIFGSSEKQCRRITKRCIINLDSIESIEIIGFDKYEC